MQRSKPVNWPQVWMTLRMYHQELITHDEARHALLQAGLDGFEAFFRLAEAWTEGLVYRK